MSKSRAKKKQRRRARGAAAPPTTTSASSATAQERATARAQARARAEPAKAQTPAPDGRARPSRLEVRDGVPRPDAIWAPFPLTELGTAAGIGLFAIGLFSGAPALFLAGTGILVVVIGELCLREHFSGFRSHSILLGLLPVTAVHLGVVYAGALTWRGPLALAIDLAVAGALAWWLQRRFVAAQGNVRLGKP